MYRKILLALAAGVGWPAAALGQPIVVIPEKGAGQWTISFTRMFEKGDAATGTELSGFSPTLAGARAQAAKLQAWSRSMDANTSWRLKKIYLEGEDAAAGPPADAAPKSPSLIDKVLSVYNRAEELKGDVDDAKWALKLVTDPGEAIREKGEDWQKKYAPGAVLQEYSDNVAGAYQRVKDLKDPLLKMEKDVMEKSFKKVNDAVLKYNREVDAGAKFFGPKGNPLPKLAPVGPGTAKKVEDWKGAVKQQFDLDRRKDDLDRRKEALDRDREKLAADWKQVQEQVRPFNPADPRVVRLRDRSKEYKAEADRYGTEHKAFAAEVGALSTRVVALGGRPAAEKPAHAAFTVTIRWDTATDVDLWITEPNGQVCNYQRQRTANGGALSPDDTKGYGPEVYRMARGPLGSYRIDANMYALRGAGPTTVTAEIVIDPDTPRQRVERHRVVLSRQSQTATIVSLQF